MPLARVERMEHLEGSAVFLEDNSFPASFGLQELCSPARSSEESSTRKTIKEAAPETV